MAGQRPIDEAPDALPRYTQGVAKFPVRLQLTKAPRKCVGQAGLYNHFEFLKALILISDGLCNVWHVQELLWAQDSLCDHHAMGPQKDLGKPKVRADASKAASLQQPDVFMFDDPFLKQGTAASAGAADKSVSKEGESKVLDASDHDSDVYTDACPVDLSDIEEEEIKQAGSASGSGGRGAAAVPRADVGEERGPQVKTYATDFPLVRKALGSRRPGQLCRKLLYAVGLLG